MSPLTRYAKLSDAKKKHLLAVARKEFASHGYDHASFNRIIKESGLSKGAMYYYFADKADLFCEVVSDALLRIAEKMEPPGTAATAEEYWRNVKAIVDQFDDVAAMDPELGAIGRAVYSGGGADSALKTLRDQAEDWIANRLAEGQPIGAVRTDIELSFLARALTSMMIGLDSWFVENLSELDEVRLERLSAQAYQMCRDLAEPPKQQEILQ